MSPDRWLMTLQAAPSGSPFDMLVPMGAIFLIFYLLLIRPQQKKQREQEEMLKAIERGDQVVTTGGIHGKVVGVTDDTLTLEIAALKNDRVRIKVSRGKVEQRLAKGGDEG